LGPGCDAVGFLGVRFYPGAGDDVAKKAEFGGEEVRFCLVAVNTSLSEGLKNGGAVPFMFLHGLRPYYDVIEIHMANLADEFPECVSHLALVCRWSVASTLWHDGPFIESPRCSYSGEVNVVRVYTGLEEGIGHIHLAKYFPLPAVGEYIIDAG
jgi:hypothetical protein